MCKLKGGEKRMYFSNIISKELKPFHNSFGVDFSISLTDLLDNPKLFNIEEITETLYKVYPLIYCNEIISNNPADKIIDNKCLILQKQEHETYLSFRTNSEESQELFEEYLNIKSIGTKLTTDEFNAMIYRLRKNSVLHETLNFKTEKKIKSDYATYEFLNAEHLLSNNQGLIINDKLKNNPVTVKLSDTSFNYANYTLNVTVKSITGANILDDSITDYIVEDTFQVPLQKNTECEIDVSDYVNDSVLLFDCTVDVDFNIPEIRSDIERLILTSNKNTVEINNQITLTAEYYDSESNPVANVLIEFYNGITKIGEAYTNNAGIATLQYTATNLGSNSIYAEYNILTSNTVYVTVVKQETVINVSANPSILNKGESTVLTGTLTHNNIGLSNKTIDILIDNTVITSVVTNSNGEFSYTYTNSEDMGVTETITIEAAYDGDTIYADSNDNVDVIFKAVFNGINLSSDKDIISYNGGVNPEHATLTAQLTYNDSSASVSEKPVTFEIMSPGFYMYAVGVALSSSHSAPCTFRWKKYGDVVSINHSAVIDLKDYSDYTVIHLVWDSDKSLKLYVDGVEVQGKITLNGSVITTWNESSIQLNSVAMFQFSEYTVANPHAYYEKQTANTNSSGVATVSYTSKGAGDLNIKAECMFVSKRYDVVDAWKYDNASSDKSSQYTQFNSPSFSYNSNGYYTLKKQSGENWGFVTPYNTPITTNDNVSIEMTIINAGMFGAVGLYKSNTLHLPLTYYSIDHNVGMYGYGSTNNWIIPTETISTTAPLKLKLELKNGVLDCYVYDNNGTLVWSKTNVSIPSTFNNTDLKLVVGDPLHNSTNNYVNFKDILIKPL